MEGGKGVRVWVWGDNSSRDDSQLSTVLMQRKTDRGAVSPGVLLLQAP